MNKQLILLTTFLVVISGNGVNNSIVQELINSYPQKVYVDLDEIEFKAERKGSSWGNYRHNWITTLKGVNITTNTKVTIYQSNTRNYNQLRKTLYHELSHHWYYHNKNLRHLGLSLDHKRRYIW